MDGDGATLSRLGDRPFRVIGGVPYLLIEFVSTGEVVEVTIEHSGLDMEDGAEGVVAALTKVIEAVQRDAALS